MLSADDTDLCPNICLTPQEHPLTHATTVPREAKPRLNVLVIGDVGIGKSSLVEHLMFSLNSKGASKLVKKRYGSKQFGNLSQKSTQKITMYPLETSTHQLELIDTPGIPTSAQRTWLNTVESLI